jgi:lipopolysaccharide/colanic/teichoic acid biosynthesis glycosyltransferase
MVRANRSEAIAIEGDIKNRSNASSAVGYFRVKRFLDIVGSAFLLLMLMPLFLVISVIIYIFSPGPVVYKSHRYGRDGKVFHFLKFRSMYVDADAKQAEFERKHNEKDGAIFKMKNDPRVTPIGRFIRRFSLDELPQLINVFRGDMSLVGPRPLPVHQGDKLNEKEKGRMSVPQGITCFWQVMGRSDLSFSEMIDLDLKYAEELGFMTDIKIVCLTPGVVLTGKGAY